MPRKNSFVDTEPIEEKKEETIESEKESNKIQNEGKIFSSKKHEGGTRLS